MAITDREQYMGNARPVDTRPGVDVLKTNITQAFLEFKQDPEMQELGINFLNPGPKKERRLVNSVSTKGSIDLYIPVCPDYQGDAEDIGNGVGSSNISVLEKLPRFAKFFASRGVPASCTVILADVEALDDFRQQKLGMSQQDILDKIRSSVPNLKGFAETCFSDLGRAVSIRVQTMLQDGYYTEEDDLVGVERAAKLSGNSLVENFLSNEALYRRWIPNGAYDPNKIDGFHKYVTDRIAKQYVRRFTAFGHNIAQRNGVIFTFPTRNNDYYPALAFVCNKNK